MSFSTSHTCIPSEEKLLTGKQAEAVVQWVVTGTGLNQEPDERILFKALRTCAKRAGRDNLRKLSTPARNVTWDAHWQTMRSYLVERNMGLAYSVVHRMGSHKVNQDDLLSDALLGLTRAVDQFNPWKGYRFSTYACTVIARDMMRRCRRETSHRRMFPVQHEEIHERPTDRIDAGTELYVERLQRVLHKNEGDLTDLETHILSQRFPADSDGRLTFLEIGRLVGLSKERVRQIQKVALGKLRRVLDEDPVLQRC
jgi:RNA polymerase sigma factor (sigma-70 family)